MSAKVILTDSGGMQKEAYFHRVPCITLRDETEWTETVEQGWNQISGTDANSIISAWEKASTQGNRSKNLFGKGNASKKIIDTLLS